MALSRCSVVLTSAVSGERLYDTQCWIPCVVVSNDTEWETVPVKEIFVLVDGAARPLQHLHIPRKAPDADEVTLPILFNWPVFTNALYDLDGAPVDLMGKRRWRKEFRRHAEQFHYKFPVAMQGMTVEIANRFKAWILQAWVALWRRHREHHFDTNKFYGRFRHTVVENLADTLGLSDDDAEGVLMEFEELNMAAYLELLRFLWLPENQYHCFVD